MVTKDMLAQLRSTRAQPRYANEMTPFGNVIVRVHSEIENRREEFIAQGEQTLQESLENFRRQQKLAATRGLGSREFNAQTREI